MAYDCFLSYASQDLAHAEAVHARLTTAGFTVWFDKARLHPGYDWHKEIEEGCETSRVTLPLLTPRWKQSEWTRYETYGAEAVIPLLVEGRWEDVSTPPLTPFQNFCVPLATSTEADWQRLFDSIREFCAREAPQQEQRVHRLRYHPARHFVGREKDLDEIHEKLFVNPTAALTQGHVQAIAAMGGVGKTTLARQYAEKFWRCYPQMFWADCRLGLETEFGAIHDILRPEPVYAELSTKDKAAWVRFEFSQSANRPRRLLILDNAEDEESVLEWIPKTGNCHTLITSRFTGWSSGIETYRVWVLDPESACELLLRRSGRTDTPVEREACGALGKKLEYLPLALEQAAAYVGAQPPRWGFAEYLRLYEANEQAFLMEKSLGATEYPDSVYLTWRATINRLPQGARAILRLHAFLASTPIPVAMFVRRVVRVLEEARKIAMKSGSQPDVDLDGAGEFAVRKWIASLTNYSMAQSQPSDSFSVHGLVHAVEWHALGDERFDSLSRMTDIFSSYAPTPSWETDNRRIWGMLLPHAVQLNKSAERLSAIQTPEFLARLASAYRERGQYRQAILPQRRCVVVCESLLGAENPATLSNLNNLALFLQSCGEYDEAESLYRKALSASERVLGPEHVDTLTTVSCLAEALRARGKHLEAEPLCNRVLELRERALGPEHPSTVISLNNFASFLLERGRFDESEKLYRKALEVGERGRPGHPATLTTINNLAGHFRARGQYAQAEELNRRVLHAQDGLLGPRHPDTLLSVDNLAEVLFAKGEYAESESLYHRSLEGRRGLLGEEHPDTLLSQSHLATLLRAKGDHAAAEPMVQHVFEASKRVLGEDHPLTIIAVNNMALTLQRRGEHQEAESLLRRALERNERRFGVDHSNTIANLNNLAEVLRRRGALTEAELFYRRALKAGEQTIGRDHPDTLRTLGNLAVLLSEKGDTTEAESLCHEALQTQQRVLGADHRETLTSLNNLARMLERKGDDAEAEALYRQALQGSEHLLGPEHPDTVIFRANLARVVEKKCGSS